LILLILYAACVALAAGLLTPIAQASRSWVYLTALLGPFIVLYLIGVALSLTLERITSRPD
jgi:hypothetical protein